MAVMALIVMRELLDNTIRSEEDVTQNCQHPILAPVPDLAASGKGQYGYTRDGQKEKDDHASGDKRTQPMVGKNIGFAAQESYKLLRTKLQFSFADDNACHVIGISSALPGEGKSVTAINLAYSLSELGKRVILLDADMRRPTLAEKLNINKKPGLSSYLTGQSDLNELVQNCNIAGDEKAFHVIAAGQNPPNPVELLSSSRMDLAIETLRKQYDYVIFDLPPIVEVSDTLAIAQKVDGRLVVVRQNHCNRLALNMTLRQLAFVDAKVLGVVFNAVADEGRPYGRKYYRYYKNRYGRYYNRYYRQHHYYGHPSDGKSKKGEK
jgi:capsular exopolysaccharide synthesis family protein